MTVSITQQIENKAFAHYIIQHYLCAQNSNTHNMRTNRTSLVSVSDRTAEMVMLLADIKELHAKATSVFQNAAGKLTSEQEQAQKTVFADYYGFWQSQLFEMIKKSINDTQTEL